MEGTFQPPIPTTQEVKGEEGAISRSNDLINHAYEMELHKTLNKGVQNAPLLTGWCITNSPQRQKLLYSGPFWTSSSTTSIFFIVPFTLTSQQQLRKCFLEFCGLLQHITEPEEGTVGISKSQPRQPGEVHALPVISFSSLLVWALNLWGLR